MARWTERAFLAGAAFIVVFLVFVFLGRGLGWWEPSFISFK
jgi:hypothetical protein